MKVKLERYPGAAYALIDTETERLDIKLEQGSTAGASMRQSAKEMREQAERLIKRAAIVEAASELI